MLDDTVISRPGGNLVETLPLTGSHVAVAGLFKTRCGLQRGARLMLTDLIRRGFRAGAVDLSAPLHCTIDTADRDLPVLADAELATITDVIVHLNPPLFADALSFLKDRINPQARIVGYWAWELQVVSDAWRDCARLCSEIWVPSPFVAQAMLAELPDFHGNIRVIPHQVDLDPMPCFDREQRRCIRENRGIAPSDFVCGVSFAFGSNYARKNPVAAVDAFMHAFAPDEAGVRMMIRCHDIRNNEIFYEHLVSYAAADRRIEILDPSGRAWPIPRFYAALDAFVSLHRSEG